jgi:hypothetical protein
VLAAELLESNAYLGLLRDRNDLFLGVPFRHGPSVRPISTFELPRQKSFPRTMRIRREPARQSIRLSIVSSFPEELPVPSFNG